MTAVYYLMDKETLPNHAGIIREYHRAMQTKDADLLASLYAEDAVHELPFSHDASSCLHGREAVRERYKSAWAATPVNVDAITNVTTHSMADPELAVCEFDICATNMTSGAKFTASCVLILRARNGCLVHVRDYIDGLTIARALGVAAFGAGGT